MSSVPETNLPSSLSGNESSESESKTSELAEAEAELLAVMETLKAPLEKYAAAGGTQMGVFQLLQTAVG